MKNLKFLTIIGTALIIATVLAGCKGMQIVSMDRAEGPARVRQGMNIEPREITVWATYADGSTKVANISVSNINFNRHTPGPQTVRVRAQQQEISFQTEVMALRSISVSSQPRTLTFKQGDEPDPRWPGLEIRGEWDQMGSAPIPLNMVEITGYMKDQAGRQTISVNFEGMTTTFDITVVSMTAIEIAQNPAKRDYIQGEPLDLAGLRVMGVWEGFPSQELNITMDNITGFNTNNAGEQRITVTYNDTSAFFTVEVWVLSRVEMERPPAKRDYEFGEPLDLEGILMYGIYTGSDVTKTRRELIPVEQLTITGYNPNLIQNDQRVRIGVGNITADVFVNVRLPAAQ